MNSITLSGTLLTPANVGAGYAAIRITSITTIGVGSVLDVICDSQGNYSTSLTYGTHRIAIKWAMTNTYINQGVVVVDNNTPIAIDVYDIISYADPLSNAQLAYIEEILEGVENAAEISSTAATSSAASASSAASSAALASQISGLTDVAGAMALSSPANLDWDVNLPLKQGKTSDTLNGLLEFSRASGAYHINNSGYLEYTDQNVLKPWKWGFISHDSTTVVTKNNGDCTKWVPQYSTVAAVADPLILSGANGCRFTATVSGDTQSPRAFVSSSDPIALAADEWITIQIFAKSGTANGLRLRVANTTSGFFGDCVVNLDTGSKTGAYLAGGEFFESRKVANGYWMITSSFKTTFAASFYFEVIFGTYDATGTVIYVNGVSQINNKYIDIHYPSIYKGFGIRPFTVTGTSYSTIAANSLRFPIYGNEPERLSGFSLAFDIDIHGSIYGTTASDRRTIISHSNRNLSLNIFAYNDAISVFRGSTGYSYSVSYSSTITQNRNKLRVVVTFSQGNVVNTYINGVKVGSSTQLDLLTDDDQKAIMSSGYVYIGSQYGTGLSRFLSGFIKNVRFINRELSASEAIAIGVMK